MRLAILLLASLALTLSACAKKAGPAEPVAGLFALQGSGAVLRGESWRRSAQPGMTLGSNMTVELSRGSRAVLEGLNGRLVPLDAGRHPLASIQALRLAPEPKRRVFWVTDQAEERDAAALISAARYEPMQSGRKLKDPNQESTAEGMAFFFTPLDSKDDSPDEPVRQAPPWIASRDYVRALRQPLVSGDGARRLVSAKGCVVVEFSDHATAFAEELRLPLDLGDVWRVVVVDGGARLALPGGRTLELGEGQEAELH